MSLSSLCRDSVTIQQNTPTSDGAGGMPASWSDLYTNVACRIQISGARYIRRQADQRWGAMATLATHRIFIPDGTLTLREDMRIVRGGVLLHTRKHARRVAGPVGLGSPARHLPAMQIGAVRRRLPRRGNDTRRTRRCATTAVSLCRLRIVRAGLPVRRNPVDTRRRVDRKEERSTDERAPSRQVRPVRGPCRRRGGTAMRRRLPGRSVDVRRRASRRRRRDPRCGRPNSRQARFQTQVIL